jgi:hypothetical protein
MLRHLFLVAVLVYCQGAAAQPADNKSAGSPISVSAGFDIVHGPSWSADMIPSGTVHVTAYYSEPLRGSAFGTFFGGEEKLNAVRKALDDSSFFTLPSDIRPTNARMHRPDFILEVTLGEKAQRVRLYDPAGLPKQSEDVSRFFKVWNAVFDKIPLRPDVERAR